MDSASSSSPLTAETVKAFVQQQVAAAMKHLPASGSGRAAAAANPQLPQLPRLKEMTKFKGTMGTALDNWERELQQHFDYYSTMLVNDSAKVLYAATNLQEGALTFYQTSKAAGLVTGATTFDEFMQLLRDRYRPANAARQAREQLSTLRQYGQQSVSSYTDAFQAALAHIPDMSTADQVFAYTHGLQPAVASKVMEKDPASLPDAIKAAVLAESMFSMYRKPSSGNGFNHGFRNNNGATAMDLSQMEADEYGGNGESAAAAAASSQLDGGAAQILAKMEQMMDAKLSSYVGMQGKYQGQPQARRARTRVTGISPELVAKRMKNGECLACGQTGHRRNECNKCKRLANGVLEGIVKPGEQ
jgi:hypothetical protein